MNHFPLKLELKDVLNQIPLYFMQSNQNLKSFINSYGGGYTKFNDMTITSHRGTTGDGIYFYIKDLETNEFWNSALWPSNNVPETYTVLFDNKKIEFQRTNNNIETTTECVLSPTENILIKKITLKNLSSKRRTIEVTSCVDIVLVDDNRRDLDHQQFHNLFIQSKYDQNLNGLLFTRRSFSSKTVPPALFHKMIAKDGVILESSFETNRGNFIGRLRDLGNPSAMEEKLTNFEGDVLDPIAALRCKVEIGSNESVEIYFSTIVDPFIENVMRIGLRYNSHEAISGLFEDALNAEDFLIKDIGIFPEKILLYQRIGSLMIAGNLHTDYIKKQLERNHRPVNSLWSNKISGDYPILLVEIDNMYFNELIEDVLKCHEYLFRNGYDFDLVLLDDTNNPEATDKIKNVISMLGFESKIDKSKGIFVQDARGMNKEDVVYMKHFAQLIVNANNFNIVLSND